MMVDVGPVKMSERLLDVTDRLCDRLSRAGISVASCRERDRASGIVAFDAKGRNPLELKKTCKRARSDSQRPRRTHAGQSARLLQRR